ncbi:hypothetical protein [Neisseria lactamica]|uniref:hypothetical protein n=1 Tax=Neisseria lactamica TaxID=486 RepID=UPI00128FCDED|nr:hypothetical protein [Neisseria lactamica]
MPSETVSRFRRHFGFRRAEAHPAILPPSGTDAKIMAGRNGRVGFSPPLQTASALPVIPAQAGIQTIGRRQYLKVV